MDYGYTMPRLLKLLLDMDLIEILWQQDIDLGISRNAFDANLREKSQAYEIEQHEKPELVEKPLDDSPPAGFSVDSETGEWISVPALPQNQDVAPLLIIPNTSDVENSVAPLDETFDIEEAMKILEAQLAEQAALDPVEPAQTSFELGESDITPDPIPGPLVDEIENLNSMVANNALNSLQDEPLVNEGRFLTDDVVPNEISPPDPSFARPMYEPHHTPPMFSRIMSMEQRWDDLTSIMLDDVSQINDTELFRPTGYPLEPESPASNLLPQFNSSLPTSSNDTNYDFGSNDVLFPNVSSIQPALPEPNESLIELLKSDDIEKMEFDEFPEVDADMKADHSPEDSTEEKRSRQMSLCTTTSESYADSAISGMSSPCGDMDEDVERNDSPYDFLLGATGGSYQSSPRSGKSRDDFYDSDGSFSDYSSSRHDSQLNYSSSSNDTGRRPSVTNIRNVNHNHTYHTQPGQPPREVKQYVKKDKDKVKETRDEKRIKSLKLPLSVDEIVEMPVDDLNQYMQEKPLTEDQLQLIKDIRRRGKNKVAAQNCRKRKMNEIDELQEEIDKFKENGAQLQVARHSMEDEMSAMRRKYDNLYAEVFKSLKDSDGDPYNPDLYSLQMTSDGAWVLMPRNTTTTVERRRRETKAEPKKKTHSKRKK
ncbi:nuclear factor erythroid 2-related factor 2-like isoform X2 [Lineus longissimus]|uniref:nuclear factor erythroid 2-related factor 2-like isoform X2 n=1 Tax=Lineus longissimus TaxID=88925 RepID=UPI00315CB59A